MEGRGRREKEMGEGGSTNSLGHSDQEADVERTSTSPEKKSARY